MTIKTLFATVLLVSAGTANAVTYSANFSGAAENPANASTATGSGLLRVAGNTIFVNIDFANLGSGLRDGHIHCCVGPTGNAGVAIGFTGLPIDATSGSIDLILDLTNAATFRPAFITASGGTVDLARARLFTALDAGQVYYNLHTVNFPGGEIRGNLSAVPEPASWAMLIAGFGLVGAVARRRKAELA
jgi:CHRD domain/PEP-CTERM motif